MTPSTSRELPTVKAHEFTSPDAAGLFCAIALACTDKTVPLSVSIEVEEFTGDFIGVVFYENIGD